MVLLLLFVGVHLVVQVGGAVGMRSFMFVLLCHFFSLSLLSSIGFFFLQNRERFPRPGTRTYRAYAGPTE